MVPVGGLEPPRLATTDFESVVYTNFTTPATQLLQTKLLEVAGIIRDIFACAIVFLSTSAIC